MARTIQEQLDDVDAAIAKIENGAQEYRMSDGRGMSRGDLGSLYAERQRLEKKLSRSVRGGISVRLGAPRRT